ncbi:hypothetical protein DXN33_05915 [Streptococcus sp. NM]|nr:hypothetical protein DXN33_05915 [Streptococcus sp. NM]
MNYLKYFVDFEKNIITLLSRTIGTKLNLVSMPNYQNQKRQYQKMEISRRNFIERGWFIV